MIAALREGDAVVVWKLDRLGRSVQDLVTLVDGFRRKQVQFISLTKALIRPRPAVFSSSTFLLVSLSLSVT